MRPVMLDTNAYSAIAKGEKEIIEIVQQAVQVALSPIVIGELLAGFDYGNQSKKNRTLLLDFLESSRVKIFPITNVTANFFSTIFVLLKSRGRPIPTNDMWIAAQCLEQGCVLCTYDKHFSEIDGLIIGTDVGKLLL